MKPIKILFFVSLISYLAYQLFSENNLSNKSLVPVEAEYVGVLRIQNLIPQLLLESDELSNTTLFDKITELKDKKNEVTLGIKLTQDIVAYSILHKNHRYMCLLFNLNSPKDFETNFRDKTEGNVAIAVKDATGLAIFPTNTEISQDLNALANSLIDSKKHFVSSEKFENHQSIISIYSKDKNNQFNHSLHVSFIKNSLNLNGKLHIETPDVAAYSALKPEGLSISSNIYLNLCPAFILDGLFDQQLDLKSFSLNIKGMDLSSNEILPFTPDFDLFIQGKPESFNQDIIRYHTSILKDAELRFYMKTYNDSMYYIGTNSSPEIYETNDFLTVTGDLSCVTNIHGNKFAKKLIKILPFYQPLENLSNRTKNIDFRINSPEHNLIEINGDYTFKGSKSAIVQTALILSAFLE